jgi:hypothetical protein
LLLPLPLPQQCRLVIAFSLLLPPLLQQRVLSCYRCCSLPLQQCRLVVCLVTAVAAGYRLSRLLSSLPGCRFVIGRCRFAGCSSAGCWLLVSLGNTAVCCWRHCFHCWPAGLSHHRWLVDCWLLVVSLRGVGAIVAAGCRGCWLRTPLLFVASLSFRCCCRCCCRAVAATPKLLLLPSVRLPRSTRLPSRHIVSCSLGNDRGSGCCSLSLLLLLLLVGQLTPWLLLLLLAAVSLLLAPLLLQQCVCCLLAAEGSAGCCCCNTVSCPATVAARVLLFADATM